MSTCANDRAVIYIVPREDCSNCFVVQLGKVLSERLGQHKYAVRLDHSNNWVLKYVRMLTTLLIGRAVRRFLIGMVIIRDHYLNQRSSKLNQISTVCKAL